MEIALIENIQREDLNPLEEAQAYNRLMVECNISQAELAAKVGKDRSSIANSIRLLSLPAEVREMVAEKMLSSGHARTLLAAHTDSEKIALAKRVIAENISVRELEKIVYGNKTKSKSQSPKARPAQIVSIEEALKRKLATKVSLNHKRKGGKIVIEYYSNDELNRLLEVFGVLENF